MVALTAVAIFALSGVRESLLQRRLQSIVEEHSTFWNVSLSFAIHNDSVEIAVAAGANDYSNPGASRLTTDTQIPAGSTTKMYTAIAVLRLAEQGIIGLDQPIAPLVDKYLSKTPMCASAPSFCESKCAPRAECFTSVNCTDISREFKSNCSYCLRYLPCYDKPVATLLGLWEGNEYIEEVTFRQLIWMSSGLMDYYNSPNVSQTETSNEWLYYAVLNSTRDVEPLEFLMHQSKSFLFKPGSTTVVPRGVPGAGMTVSRGSYSTNAFSLVGLALTGLLELDDWSDLDQAKLAWGERLPADQPDIFPKRGTCLTYPQVAHQYASVRENVTFEDITNHSCLNSWMGGNIAPRPTDAARFTYAAYRDDGQALISASSRSELLTLHPLTDGHFAEYYLAYGLGLEALWNRQTGGGELTQLCSGGDAIGHGGLDYGSGALLQAYVPSLRLGVSLASTSAQSFGSAVSGMNCSRPWSQLKYAASYAQNALMNAVAVYAGVTPTCPELNFTLPSADECVDAPSFGALNGQATTCAAILPAFARPPSSEADVCNSWLSVTTLAGIKEQLAASGTDYEPPAGLDPNTTLGIELCRGSCGAVAAGPCWLRAKVEPWC